jgi:hypothetical protein
MRDNWVIDMITDILNISYLCPPKVLEFRIGESAVLQDQSTDSERMLCIQRVRGLLRDMTGLELWGRRAEAMTRSAMIDTPRGLISVLITGLTGSERVLKA